jgi:hypothetical protein
MGQDPAHRRGRQAERAADRRYGGPGSGGGRDRLITVLPGGGGVVNA